MERRLQPSAANANQTTTESWSRKKWRREKHRETGKRDTPGCGTGKEEKPGCTPGRFAWLVWHLTSLSLYTELITVMQRAQFYFNKARDRERDRQRGGKLTRPWENKEKKNTTEHFLQKTRCVITESLS